MPVLSFLKSRIAFLKRSFCRVFNSDNFELVAVMENISEGIYQSTSTGRILRCNQSFASILGYKSSDDLIHDIVHVGLDIYVNPDDRTRLLNRLRKDKKVTGFETQVFKKNGEPIWIRINVAEYYSAHHCLTLYDGSIVDISTEVQAKKDKERVMARSEAILEHSSDLVTIVSMTGKILFETSSVEVLTGYKKGEWESMELESLINPKDREKLKNLFAEVIHDPGITVRTTFDLKRKDGVFIPVEAEMVNRLADPNIGGIIIHTRDISDRLKQDNKIRKQNESLNLVNAEMDRFVYALSHEIRSPVTTILGILQLAAPDYKNSELESYFNQIQDCTNRLDNFIRNLVDYQHLIRRTPEFKSINLTEMVENSFTRLRSVAEQMNVVTYSELNPDIAITSDPFILNIILSHLITNGIVFSNPAQAHKTVKVSAVKHPNKTEITLSDNGLGITPDQQHKIFDMFFRGRNSSMGTGIGLYLVKKALEKLEGEISFESNPGSGSVFKLFIPEPQLKKKTPEYSGAHKFAIS